MTAKLLDGRQIAAQLKAELRQRVQSLQDAGICVGLGTILVGDDPASHKYVAGKHRDCGQIGIKSLQINLPATATLTQVLASVDQLNNEPACTGFLVQLPLPAHLDAFKVLSRVDPQKDVDGLHPVNLGNLALRVGTPLTAPLPCTPRAVVEILRNYGVNLAGKHVVVIGRGTTVGRSIGLLLTHREINATVTLTHSATVDLPNLVRQADVVVAAAGQPHLVQADWVKPGAVVVDVGVSRVDSAPNSLASNSSLNSVKESKSSVLLGDVHPEVAKVASFISRHPGGVGPMTRAMLLTNLVEMAESQINKK